MSRMLKYRAYHKATKRMYEVLSIDFTHQMITCPCKDGCETGIDGFHFSEVELMEYTGRLDHHDIEMAEGDIIEYIDNTSRGLVKKITVIKDIRHLPDFSCSKWEEIIGNVWENRDLLGKVSNESRTQSPRRG